MYLPLGETMTGCTFLASWSMGICSIVTSTEPRLVPTHSEGLVIVSATINNAYSHKNMVTSVFPHPCSY